MTEREFASDVVRRLRQAGYDAYWAGGCVRDELLGLTPADYDVATNATPDQVTALFKRTVEVGASFGVVEVIGPRQRDGSMFKVQVATFRNDGQYSDGRRPDSVTFSTAAEDAQRRDFTINGMFFDPLEQRVLDYVGGQADLHAKVLRAIGDPYARFREDKLRLLRAVRMAARFGFPIEAQTLAAIQAMAPEIVQVSAERIAEELRKMLVHPARGWALHELRERGLLAAIIPELRAVEAPLWATIVRVLETLAEPRWPDSQPVSFPLALAALLHTMPLKTVSAVCLRLKLANVEKGRTEWLVKYRDTLQHAPQMLRSQLYPLLVQPGIGELLALQRTLALVAGESCAAVDWCEATLRQTPLDVLNPPPLLTGDDLLALGLKQGPQFKVILDTLRAAQLDGTITTVEEAHKELGSGKWERGT